jgi:two-component system, NarL family, response regulator NreC
MASDEPQGSRVTIVLADDHQVVREGLRLLLEAEEGFEVLDEAGDVETTLRKVLAYRPRVLVLDLNMPGTSSLEAIPQVIEMSPRTGIVILTMQDNPAMARDALRAGALGYVLKEASHTELVQAVRLAAAGRTYLNPGLGARLAAASSAPAGPPDFLSKREVDVLELIAVGHTNAEIAEKLYLSVRTVESHRARVQLKTGCGTRAELVAYARAYKLAD